MKVLSLGSLNLDHVYAVDHFVRGGETIASRGMNEFCGGKGLNQSVALAKAGAEVYHAGKIGPDGEVLRRRLEESGVDTACTRTAAQANAAKATIAQWRGRHISGSSPASSRPAPKAPR